MQGSEFNLVNRNLMRPSGIINFKKPEEELTRNVPVEIWQQIFGYVGCGQFRTFAEFARVEPQSLMGLNAVRLMKDKREVNERREANKELIFKAKVKTSC